MSASNGATKLRTTNHTSEIADLVNTVSQFGVDTSHILGVSGVTFQHDLGQIQEEVGLMAMYNLISAVSLVFHVDGTLVRSYDYDISGRPLTAEGPAAGQTPVAASFPPGTVASIRVTPKPGAKDHPLYQRLGWKPTTPLKGERQSTKIGTFVSGNYGWERILTINPALDHGNRS